MNMDIQTLRRKLDQVRQQCEKSEVRIRNSERRFRVLGGLALATVMGAMLVSPADRAALAQGYGTTLQQILDRLTKVENRVQNLEKDDQTRFEAMDKRVATLEQDDNRLTQLVDGLHDEVHNLNVKTKFIQIGADGEMRIVGTNLHIENGLGATNGEPNNPFDTSRPAVNGLGNLIIGYNALRNDPASPDVRTGSHNLILGDANNFPACGGLVAGQFNTVFGPYATVTGGTGNVAGGILASVSGGSGNVAGGDHSSVSGGSGNTAGGPDSSVSGGQANLARGGASSVSGGRHIGQSVDFGWSAGSQSHVPFPTTGNFVSP